MDSVYWNYTQKKGLHPEHEHRINFGEYDDNAQALRDTGYVLAWKLFDTHSVILNVFVHEEPIESKFPYVAIFDTAAFKRWRFILFRDFGDLMHFYKEYLPVVERLKNDSK